MNLTVSADSTGQYLPDFEILLFPSQLGDRALARDLSNATSLYVEVQPTLGQAPAVQRRLEIVWASDPGAHLLIASPASDWSFAFGLPVAAGRCADHGQSWMAASSAPATDVAVLPCTWAAPHGAVTGGWSSLEDVPFP